MNSDNINNADGENQQLRFLLRAHCAPAPARNPEFRAAVWRGIEARRAAGGSWGGWLHANLRRATALAAACVVFAGAAGGLLAFNQAGREREQLIHRYIMSIDATLMAGADGAHGEHGAQDMRDAHGNL